MRRKRLLTAATGVLLAVAIAGGVAYATIPGPGNVYNACMLRGLGTIRLIDKSLPSTNLMSRCTDKENEISWNQAGQPGPAGPQGAKGEPGTNGTNGTDGKDGMSVTASSEPTGANCVSGGVQLTAVNGVNYVCNGKDGKDGRDGIDGTNGANGVDGTDGQDGQGGVSVTSAIEPAGANCVNGGSKFTAANGVTYACNGTNGSGSAGHVLFARVGGAMLDPLQSVTLASTPQLTAVATCISGFRFALGVYSPSDPAPPPAQAAFWDGAEVKYMPTGGGGAGGFNLADPSHPESSFSGIVLKANGLSFEARGKATFSESGCSIVYHASVSQG
jgi:hypothetical protein